jgi:alkylation response protein AidB-like acyl-CoA dehydrogenase
MGRALIREIFEDGILGYFGLYYPEAYGGMDLDFLYRSLS